MNIMERVLLIAAVLLAGCGTTRNVAVTSYHVTRDVAVGSYRVATAPVHYALKGRGEPKMVGTTEAASSDVTEPGQPVSTSEVTSAPRRRSKHLAESSQSQNRHLRRLHIRRRNCRLPKRCLTSLGMCSAPLIPAEDTSM